MELAEWIWKYYTQEGPNTVTCNRCLEILPNHNRLQILKYHLYDKHGITELDGHPERDIIQENFKITCLTATCNHCKGKSNLAIYGVHILIIHLRTIHSDKYNLNKRRSGIWAKYDITDNKAICKQCKRIIKINSKKPQRNLYLHLHRCRFKKIKISHIWDKFNVKESKVTCKECKGTIKVNSKIPTKNLNVHLRHCRLKMRRKISHLWDKFNVIENKATCKECKRTILINREYMRVELTQHLILYCHYFNNYYLDKCKLKEMQRRLRIWDKYEVTNTKATCRKCKEAITINRDTPATNLSEHLLQCRYSNIDDLSIGSLTNFRKPHAWEKFVYYGDRAICKRCYKNLELSGTRPIARLRSHLKYCRRLSLGELNKDALKKLCKRSEIWKKFDVDGNKAICQKCKKALSISGRKPLENLRAHVTSCRGFNINDLSKDELKELRKQSQVSKQFDEVGNRATCKCNKILSLNGMQPSANFRNHLTWCRGLNKDELKKLRRNSVIWQKFDVEENKAICKDPPPKTGQI
ncbi:PREDICTED: uncharacterized protein LOC105564579 [Vollenhovia emeryi]|uniref:uncharacterized protein LOC105564579 n=1 Tax=Vollenhovia emeryi TaxID=411798 RepID=UPI0005F58BEB|nr:PREDICTED: uncharacterized protein LOC105564579 [Vollenhovia emeryi]